MCIGTEVSRQICLKMAGVQIEKAQGAEKCLRGQRRRMFEEIETPEPRDRAKSNFQTAGPVNSQLGRILIHPTFEVRSKGLCISLVSSEPVGLSESGEI